MCLRGGRRRREQNGARLVSGMVWGFQILQSQPSHWQFSGLGLPAFTRVGTQPTPHLANTRRPRKQLHPPTQGENGGPHTSQHSQRRTHRSALWVRSSATTSALTSPPMRTFKKQPSVVRQVLEHPAVHNGRLRARVVLRCGAMGCGAEMSMRGNAGASFPHESPLHTTPDRCRGRASIASQHMPPSLAIAPASARQLPRASGIPAAHPRPACPEPACAAATSPSPPPRPARHRQRSTPSCRPC